MNGGVAGGALAPGNAGKPGAPEDAAGARLRESRGGGLLVLAPLTGARPHLTPTPQSRAGVQLQRHLLASAPGLWRNHWPWGRSGCLTFGHSDDSTDKGNNYPVGSVGTRGQSKTVAEGSPLFLKRVISFLYKSPT